MHLHREYQQFERECRRIDVLIQRALAVRVDDPILFESIVSHAIIRLHDCWAVRCRAVILRSAIGGARTVTGNVLPAGSRLTRRVPPLSCLRATWGRTVMGRTWEPDWHIPAVSIRAAQLLGLRNETEIRNGLGACLAADEVRIVRNVIAHSLPATWSRLRSLQRDLGNHALERPADFAVNRVGGVGPRHIDDWMGDLRSSLRAAIT
jgi:hypothetical protein